MPWYILLLLFKHTLTDMRMKVWTAFDAWFIIISIIIITIIYKIFNSIFQFIIRIYLFLHWSWVFLSILCMALRIKSIV